ncbi:MAG: hypothetical protein Q8922_10935 [Bacteroidota bacterium]|nr:hypothetical protein [Bacteroidota bacterium]MDP4232639.1 hypothetical protein [Bacteroidota bacterium]MDP4243891.1 hypothetical protein [Bacteroidota bacterium]MDP4288440.1 hypothetical protein [Bacteroidota bacterium]
MNQNRNQAILAGLLVLFAMATRVLFNQLHVYNFNAVMAAGLFAGAFLGNRRFGIVIPLIAMLATDFVLGFYDWQLMLFVYGSLAAAAFIGKWYAKNATLPRFATSVLGGSLLFFMVTNGAVWLLAEGAIYPKTLAGLAQCYAAGLPFYRNTLLGDITWSTVLFGSYELLRFRLPKPKAAVA